MRSRPTIQLYSNDAPRHRGSSRPGIAVGLSVIMLFGAVAYAATGVGQPGSWTAQVLFAIVTAAFALLAARVGRSDARHARTREASMRSRVEHWPLSGVQRR